MKEPRRWVDDTEADAELREALRGAPGARSLDDVTRRRLSGKVARASALPVAAAGWLFVKSAAAALSVVVGTASVASFVGIIDWPARPVASAPSVKPAPARLPAAVPAPHEPKSSAPVAEPVINPVPSLPAVSVAPSSRAPAPGGALAAESQLLEQARRELRRAPAVALQIAAEHAQRFPHAQLASERTLIRIEALHRLGRDSEARALARGVLSGASGGLYAERVRQLLGPEAAP